MFYTFTPVKADREAVSDNHCRKVTRACDHCRLHRVRCSRSLPCLQCRKKGIPCLLSKRSVRQANRDRYGNVSEETLRVGPVTDTSHLTGCDAVSNSVSKSTPESIESMLGFMSRINAFFSVILVQLSPPMAENAFPLKLSTPYLQGRLEGETYSGSQLLRPQIYFLLSIYWRRYHAVAPIFSREDFERRLELQWKNTTKSVNDRLFVNAVMALCCHHAFHHVPRSQMFGIDGDIASMARQYFDRCLEDIGMATTVEEPTVLHIQSCILMTLYLLRTGQLQAAYNIIGLAIRVAHVLNLHQEPASNTNIDQRELLRRIWWTLVSLDFKCSKRLGKPLGIHFDKLTCRLPGECSSYTGATVYHDQCVLLTSLSLQIDQAISKRHNLPLDNDLAVLEKQAQVLTEELYLLDHWRENMQKYSSFGKLFLTVDNAPALVVENPEYETPERVSSQVLQGTLLELQYHDVMNELHRPFIRFARHFSHPERNALIDSHANTSLRHAMMSIDILHCRIAHYETLRDCSELMQWQWNAVLTIIGFMLAYPLCYLLPVADRHLVMAIEVYEATASRSFTTRAASIAKTMRERVNGLIALLKSNGSSDFRSPGQQGFISDSLNHENTESHVTGIMKDDFQVGEPVVGEDDIWSWIEETNANAWPRYHDEVTVTLADLQEPSMDSHPFTI